MNKQMIVLLIDELELRIENEGIMTLVKESNTFNLTWDYPVLIVFLTEVHQLNIFNSKVDRMLQKVINPLIQQNSLPKLQSKRLLLALAIERIKNCKIKQFQNGSIDELIQKLLSGLERETIIKELTPNSAFLQKGTSGIAWIYKQIFVLTGNSLYQHEEEQWISQSFKAEELENGYAGFFILKEQEYTALGLLEGLTGIALLSVGIKISNFLLN
jgi:hypothetical protein